MKFHLKLKSSNLKTGPIPVTTSTAVTCPRSCPFNSAGIGGCYAASGPLALHWQAVTNGKRGGTWNELCTAISKLPDGQLWRHNQAGDLPGLDSEIDVTMLAQLVAANVGRRGFTYTHKPLTAQNATAILAANREGFTINLSANNLAHADELASLGIGPVVVVVAKDCPDKFVTPAGRAAIVCPAQTRANITCATCKLCSVQSANRPIIGFRTHGSGAKRIEAFLAA